MKSETAHGPHPGNAKFFRWSGLAAFAALCCYAAIVGFEQPVAASTGIGATTASIPEAQPRVTSPQEKDAACIAEANRMRAQWKHGRGDARTAAAELGDAQQRLFEGACASHPQAHAYVAGAKQMRLHAQHASDTASLAASR
jgi:hypothetical protein